MPAEPSPVASRSGLNARLGALVERVAAGRVIAGVERCLLRVECGDRVWAGAAGLADPTTDAPLTADHAFRAASVTKMVTAATVLALCEQGRCTLGDRIGAHLADDLVGRIHVVDGVSYGPRITIRQLLDHTSGIADVFATPTVRRAIRRRVGPFTPVELVEVAIAEGRPSHPPGDGRAYTDTGFVLAGLIVEHVTGRPLQEAYRHDVLDPAGMPATWLESAAEPPRRAGVSHHFLDGADITNLLEPTVDWAGGGLVSTAGDLAALIRSLHGGTVLTEPSWAAMAAWSPGPTGYYDDYGLGLGRYRLGPVTAIGHHGYWGAFSFWLPELDAVVAGTVNTAGVDRRPLLDAVATAIRRNQQ